MRLDADEPAEDETNEVTAMLTDLEEFSIEQPDNKELRGAVTDTKAVIAKLERFGLTSVLP
jgi:hypothetical protein